MNTLKIEKLLSQKYAYRPLPGDLSDKYRQYFTENIPSWLNISGDNTALYTENGSLICKKYNRIVVGDYGAFVEFSDPTDEFIIRPGQEYRVNDKKYSKNVKYLWLTIDDGADVKIYHQKRKVAYADYTPGKYYVSVHEVFAEYV